MTDKAGLYLHIPFCERRCKYCDFYSSFKSEELIDEYVKALELSLKQWGGTFNRPIDTIYLGGGTPSLLAHRLPSVLDSVYKYFSISKNPEITLELNPKGDTESLLKYAKAAGINRLSIGAQSGIDGELKLLGRTHTAADTLSTFSTARKSGFENISLDIMLGLPSSNKNTLKKSLSFITELMPEHISAYILKLEENTAFAKENISLPDDDGVAEQYLFMCDYLENKGYSHYEISNFSKNGYESRHNLKYWKGIEYLGIGPSAHSFADGKRFYYPRDLRAFINGNQPLSDGEGGGREEFIMLSLRLKSGINPKKFEAEFGQALPTEFYNICEMLISHRLMQKNAESYSLTNEGMLLSNSIITQITECIL